MSDDTKEMDEQQAAAEHVVEGPGRRLHAAREAKHLTTGEVASRLRLNERLVVALEQDDYEDLPPAAFVSGYLRNYARLLDLPVEEIIAAYNDRCKETPSLVTVRSAGEMNASRMPVRLVTWLIVIALAVLLALWWWPHGIMHAPSAPPAEGSAPASAPAVQAPPSAEAPEAPAAPAAAPATPETAETPPPAEAPAKVPAAEPSAPATEEPAATAPPSAAAPASDEAPSTAAGETSTPATGESTVRLVFTADSWTKVTDGAGKRLLADLVRGGNTVTLHGQAPFQVTLGYSQGVEVYYNGQRFDQKPYEHQQIARFTLGAAGDSPTE